MVLAPVHFVDEVGAVSAPFDPSIDQSVKSTSEPVGL
jgi:hypothetical protein